MRFSTVAFALLPLLAMAEETTTYTSTATLTRTVTISEVHSVTSTYKNNTAAATPVRPTSTGGIVVTPSPSAFLGAASSLNGMYAGSAGLVVMIAAALL